MYGAAIGYILFSTEHFLYCNHNVFLIKIICQTR